MKKIVGQIKLQLAAGQANPAPPVGPALGQHGVNIMEFCKTFNARTQDRAGLIIPAVITIYADRSFTFELKSPPAAVLLKKAAKIDKGSAEPNREKVGTVTEAQLRKNAVPTLAIIGARDPLKTGVQAFLYEIRTAILPIVFIFNTELLLVGVDSIWQGLLVFVVSLIAILCFSSVTQRWMIVKLRLHEALLLVVVVGVS